MTMTMTMVTMTETYTHMIGRLVFLFFVSFSFLCRRNRSGNQMDAHSDWKHCHENALANNAVMAHRKRRCRCPAAKYRLAMQGFSSQTALRIHMQGIADAMLTTKNWKLSAGADALRQSIALHPQGFFSQTALASKQRWDSS